MARKGTATVKKLDKYDYICADGGEEGEVAPARLSSDQAAIPSRTKRASKKVVEDSGDENVEPGAARAQLKLSNEAQHQGKDGAGQPRQDSATVEQSAALAQSLFPSEEDGARTNDDDDDDDNKPHQTFASPANARRSPARPVLEARPRKKKTDTAQSAANLELSPTKGTRKRTASQPAPDGEEIELDYSPSMIQGGAHIPPNQQRNMRACMVCSIVRTQQQFTTFGCPNCEDILELIGNPEQVNDCTSQVFEGLISVADTNRSWVARYQRLEGYVPGVYATQVEGILPEDVLVAVESAGINYVPRDGSEQEMLGKD